MNWHASFGKSHPAPVFMPASAKRLAMARVRGDESPQARLDEREFQVFSMLAYGSRAPSDRHAPSAAAAPASPCWRAADLAHRRTRARRPAAAWKVVSMRSCSAERDARALLSCVQPESSRFLNPCRLRSIARQSLQLCVQRSRLKTPTRALQRLPGRAAAAGKVVSACKAEQRGAQLSAPHAAPSA